VRRIPLLLALLLAACSVTPRHDQETGSEIVPAVAPSAPADDPADFMSRLARL